MIKKIECFVPYCDICGKSVDDDSDMHRHFDTERDALEYALEFDYGANCEMVNGALCCPNCWTYDDDDQIVLRANKTMQTK